MKKQICMILALVMVMGLCACGESTAHSGRNNNFPNQTGISSNNQASQEATVFDEPTGEEKNVLCNYVNEVSYLNEIVAKLKEAPYYNTDGIQKHRAKLLELDLDTVRRWAGTQWAEWAYEQSYEPENFRFPEDFDCDAVMARFVKVEDVKLSYIKTATDFLGNVSTPSEETVWRYFADGTVSQVDTEFNACRFAIESEDMMTSAFDYHGCTENLREYDADGKLTKITYYHTYQHSSNVALVRLFAYDAAGKLTTQTAKTNNEERVYHYSYDTQDRLTKVKTVFDAGLYTNTYEILYTYDANGNLMKEEMTIYKDNERTHFISACRIMEYVYEASGKLVSGTYTEQRWASNIAQGNFLELQSVDQYTFELDAQGRVVKEIVIPGAFMWVQRNEEYLPAQYAQIVYETVYGDYYVYVPAE